MQDRFTERARRAMGRAREAARRLESSEIAPGHVLLGLIEDPASAVTGALRALGVDPDEVRRAVEERLGRGPGTPEGRVPLAAACKVALELALDEAGSLSHNHVGVEHLLLGLLREKEGVAGDVLRGFGLEPDRVRGELVGRLAASIDVRGLHLSGDCDSTELPGFAGQVDGLISQGHVRLFFDMRTVTFVNSAALGFFIRTLKLVREQGGDLVLVRPSEFVRTTLLTLGLHELFKVFESDEDAIRWLEGGEEDASVDLMARAVETGSLFMGMGPILFRLLPEPDVETPVAIGRITDLGREGPVVRWPIPLPDREESGCGITTENFDERVRVDGRFGIEFRIPLAKTARVIRGEARVTSVHRIAAESGAEEAVIRLAYEYLATGDRDALDRYLDDLDRFLGNVK
jgi:anti-anti-sigma factor